MKRPDPNTAALPLSEPLGSPLRRAYDAAGLARLGIPFDKAMAIKAIRIALENTARAVAKAHHRSHHA